MDYKGIAQQAAQDILGYNQDTSGWKVVKSSVRKWIKYVSNLFLNEKRLIVKTFLKYFLRTKKCTFALFYFVFCFSFFSLLDS